MTPADALTLALHSLSADRTEIERDRYFDEEVRASRLDEIDQARDQLRKLRAQYFATPNFRLASGGDDSTGPTAMTPTADAACAEPADSTA